MSSQRTLFQMEFYETPRTFTRYLHLAMGAIAPINGTVFEPCVGSRAVVDGFEAPLSQVRQWITNDLDERWPADYHLDATQVALWKAVAERTPIDWTVSNPPFTPAIEIIDHALDFSRVGVAMHLRASIHEVLKEGVRRTWMSRHTPTGLLWLPRFGYQRSKTTGKWATDGVCACWVIWLKDPNASQFIRYAPEWVLDDLKNETKSYRKRMDALMSDQEATV